MKNQALAATVAVLFVIPPAAVAQARQRAMLGETSGDLRGKASRAAAARVEARAAAAGSVGDLELGRNLTYLGVAQTMLVNLAPDCTGSSPADERCVTLSPSPEFTWFRELDLARIEVPAKATRSMMCFSLTPFALFEFLNDTGVPQPDAYFGVYAVIVVENGVLADPALVDPATGEPYGGKLEVLLGTYNESRSLAADERAYKRLSFSRSCIGGLLSTRALVEVWGLSEEQAAEFFRRPTTLRLGAEGGTALVSWANSFYGLRLYGD